MSEFWESAFKSNERMWGENPSDNARTVLGIMQKHNIKSILIPGFGYGRNAKVFYDKGFEVTGIEISKTAIERARKYFGSDVRIHHGSVTDMPIDDCYTQLEHKGIVVFVALSINDKRFGIGEKLEKNTYRSPHGLNLYFYDEAAILEEFGNYNIVKAEEIDEPKELPTTKPIVNL